MYNNIKNVINEITKAKHIVLAGHINPDGDAIASTFALALFIYKIKNIKPCILIENYPKTYDFLILNDFIYKNDIKDIPLDLFIALDCGDIERLGNFKNIFKSSKITINIDHHASNNHFGDINLVNASASSTSEIVFEIINSMQGIMDKDIAEKLYAGIIFDTSGFKHNSTTPRTHEIASAILKYGIDFSSIQSNLIYSHSLENAKLLSCTIQNLQIDKNIAISTLTKDEILKKCNASYNDLEGISAYLLDIKGIDVCAFLYEKYDDTIKVSFRAKKLNVNEIANKFGGGGHILASGASLKDTFLEQAKDAILKEINNKLKS